MADIRFFSLDILFILEYAFLYHSFESYYTGCILF